jgi:hypothetical protein
MLFSTFLELSCSVPAVKRVRPARSLKWDFTADQLRLRDPLLTSHLGLINDLPVRASRITRHIVNQARYPARTMAVLTCLYSLIYCLHGEGNGNSRSSEHLPDTASQICCTTKSSILRRLPSSWLLLRPKTITDISLKSDSTSMHVPLTRSHGPMSTFCIADDVGL